MVINVKKLLKGVGAIVTALLLTAAVAASMLLFALNSALSYETVSELVRKVDISELVGAATNEAQIDVDGLDTLLTSEAMEDYFYDYAAEYIMSAVKGTNTGALDPAALRQAVLDGAEELNIELSQEDIHELDSYLGSEELNELEMPAPETLLEGQEGAGILKVAKNLFGLWLKLACIGLSLLLCVILLLLYRRSIWQGMTFCIVPLIVDAALVYLTGMICTSQLAEKYIAKESIYAALGGAMKTQAIVVACIGAALIIARYILKNIVSLDSKAKTAI